MDALVEANVWLPILVERHEHHRPATTWWEKRTPGSATWCRFTQHAILRLLTNRVVMGDAVRSPTDAWETWQRLILDERTAFMPTEPPDLDDLWRSNIETRAPTPKLWTDAYLAALAESARLEMVTFDAGFKQFSLSRITVLRPRTAPTWRSR